MLLVVTLPQGKNLTSKKISGILCKAICNTRKITLILGLVVLLLIFRGIEIVRIRIRLWKLKIIQMQNFLLMNMVT